VPKTDDYEFAGFDPPYYTPVPDAVFDELLPRLSGNEVKVLLYIIRRTFGFKKERDAISLAQIAGGIVRHDGTRQDYGAGVSRAGAAEAIKGLLAKRIILAERQQARDGGDAPTVYALRFRGESKNWIGGVQKVAGGSPESPPAPVQILDSQETNTRNKIQEGEGTSSLPENPPAPPPPYSPVIAGAVLDLARSLRDDLAGPGAVTQALALWQQSGLSEAAFVAALQAAQGRSRKLAAVLTAVARQVAG